MNDKSYYAALAIGKISITFFKLDLNNTRDIIFGYCGYCADPIYDFNAFCSQSCRLNHYE